MNVVTVRHNFETAHRLFTMGKGTKCWNLHGHSWWVEVDVAADELDERGMVVEFGAFKKQLRSYIDDVLDHGVMLNGIDPLCDALRWQESKLYVFECDPTVECVAAHLSFIATTILLGLDRAPGARVSAVRLQETHVNGAAWTS